jgi:hypothetical protein
MERITQWGSSKYVNFWLVKLITIVGLHITNEKNKNCFQSIY